MPKEIEYINKLSAVIRAEGAPQYYTRGDQIYRQDINSDGELIPNHEEHIDWGRNPERAMKEANGFQLAANKKAQQDKKKSKTTHYRNNH